MFFSKQRWRALTALIAIGVGAALFALAQAASHTEKNSRTTAKPSVKTASASGNTSRQSTKKAATASVIAVSTAAAASTHPKRSPIDAEERLLSVIDLIERQQMAEALREAAKLAADVPNFQAAQLVYGDLLRFRTGKPGLLASPAPNDTAQSSPTSRKPGLVAEVLVKYDLPSTGSAATASSTNAQDLHSQLQGLRDELKRRVQASGSIPPGGSVPPEFLQLGASVRHAMAIDASKSRLYLFTNEGGQLRLTADYYVSVGKLGMGKTLEGDQRTPEGVYFVGRQIPGVKLPEFYGKGALTMNYPNDWDKSLGRTGDGIWLHGAPPDQFARLPEASDGCVVLANPDLISLMKTVAPQTPVLIRNTMQWVAQPNKPNHQTTDAFGQAMEAWQQAWKRDDQQTLSGLYTSAPSVETAHRPRIAEYFRLSDSATQNVSIYTWKDPKGEIRIVDLQVNAKRARKPLSLRQYWRKTGGRWEIFSEGVRG